MAQFWFFCIFPEYLAHIPTNFSAYLGGGSFELFRKEVPLKKMPKTPLSDSKMMKSFMFYLKHKEYGRFSICTSSRTPQSAEEKVLVFFETQNMMGFFGSVKKKSENKAPPVMGTAVPVLHAGPKLAQSPKLLAQSLCPAVVWVRKPGVHWCYVIFWGEEQPGNGGS